MHMTHAPNINNTFQSYPRIGTKPLFPSVSLPGKQHFPSHYTGSLLPEAVIKAIYHHLCSVSCPTTTITPTRHAPMFLCLTSLSRLPIHWALWGCILKASRIHAAVLYLYTIQGPFIWSGFTKAATFPPPSASPHPRPTAGPVHTSPLIIKKISRIFHFGVNTWVISLMLMSYMLVCWNWPL